MTSIRSTSVRKELSGFTRALAYEQHERSARRSLHDIAAFHEAVEKEIRSMNSEKAKGYAHDAEMYERLATIQAQHKKVMKAFLELDESGQRRALFTFADTIQDLMKYIHSRKVSP